MASIKSEAGVEVSAGTPENIKEICSKALEEFKADSAYFINPENSDQLDIIWKENGAEKLDEIYRDFILPTVEQRVMETHAPIMIPDSSRDPRFLVNYEGEFPAYSIMSFPIIYHDRITGVLTLYRSAEEAFGSKSIRKIQDFSQWAGGMLASRAQRETEIVNRRKIHILTRLSHTISSVQELDKAAEDTVEILKEVLDLYRCTVFFFREDSDWIRLPEEVRKVLARGFPSILETGDKKDRLIAPITYQELMPGYIEMIGYGLNKYLDVVDTLSLQLGSTARRILLDEEIDANRSKIEALEDIANFELSGVLSSSSNLSNILDSTLELIIRLLKVERLNIMLYDEDTWELRVQAYWGIDDKPFGLESMNLGEGVAGYALKIGKPYAKRKERDSVFKESPAGQEEVLSLLAYPMIVEGRKIGVINIGSIYQDRIFTEDEIRMISLIASRAALAIENNLLRKKQNLLIKEKTINNRKLKDKNQKLTERGRRLSEATRQLRESLLAMEQINVRLAELNKLSSSILGSRDPQYILNKAQDFVEKILPRPAKMTAFITMDELDEPNKVLTSKNLTQRHIAFLEKFSLQAPATLKDPLINKKENIVIHQLSVHPDIGRLRLIKGVKSFYAFPLYNKERTFGAFILGGPKEHGLEEEDVEFLSTAVNQVAMAMDNAEKYKELEMKTEMLAGLNELTGEIMLTRSQENLLDRLVKMACKLMDHNFATLMLYNQWGELEMKSKYGKADIFEEHLRNPEISMIMEEVIRRRNQIYYSSTDYEQLLKRYSLLDKAGIKSMVILPLQSRGQMLGALLVGDNNPRIHAKPVLEFYKVLGSQLALTIDNTLMMSRILLEKDLVSSVFESMKDGVISIDWERKITAFNRAAEEITGFTEEEAQGKKCYEVFKRLDVPKGGKCLEICPLVEMLDTHEHDSAGIRAEVKFRRKDGAERDLELTSSLLTQNGDPVGGVLVFRDITEKKAFQTRRSDYLAAISHDIFTPLTAMKGYVTTLMIHRDKFDLTMQQDFMRVINSEIDRMTRLLYNLMSLSRMESDKLHASPGPQVLEGLVSKIVELYSLSAKNHELIVDDSLKEAPPVFADPDHVEQILNNLVSNAIKYSPGGGEIKVYSWTGDGMVNVSVRDHGIGIDPKDRDRIFDRYQRVVNHKSRSVSGMGLGLFISKVLTELQDGKIWAESCEDGGSKFVFSLPIFTKETMALESEAERNKREALEWARERARKKKAEEDRIAEAQRKKEARMAEKAKEKQTPEKTGEGNEEKPEDAPAEGPEEKPKEGKEPDTDDKAEAEEEEKKPDEGK